MMKQNDFSKVRTDEHTQEAFYRTFMSCGKSPLKILLRIFKGNYWALCKSVFFFLLQHLPVIVSPIITANIINCATYSEEHSVTELVINAAILGVLIFQNIWSTYMSASNRSNAIRGVELNLRASMARKLQQLSITFHKEMKSGKIQSKIMRDVENIEGMASSLFTTVVSIAYSLITAISVTLSRSPVVFVFFLVSVPIAVVIMMLFRKKLVRTNSNYRHEVENTSGQVLEMVELVPITKAHALESTALYRLNQNLFRLAASGQALDRLNAIFSAISWVSFQIFQLICLTFTGYLAFKKIIPIGDITLYQSYFSSIVAQVSAIIALLPVITRGFESVRSVGDIMWAMDVEENKDKLKIDDLKGTYEFKNVHFHYHDDPHPVLRGLDLTVHQGETIALVGESGSGKSTVLNMVIGFYQPTDGEILIDGKNMNELDLQSYRSHIATVPQTSVLFSGTIRENITFGLDNCTEEQLQEAIRIANLQEVIDKLPYGLGTMVGEHGDKLSGGQRQRIAIARAVIRNAKVIIFDEATSALDTVSEKLIQDSIDKLAHNRTTFIVAHRLSTIRNADKIAVLKDGVCVEYGTWQELMDQKGEFYKFKSLQT